MRVLIISSLSPYKSANHGKRLIDIFQNVGYEVDYLTKYRFEGMADNMYSVFDCFEPTQTTHQQPQPKFKDKVKKKFPILYKLYKLLVSKKEIRQSVINLNEDSPEVDAQLVCDKIQKAYDVVYITFWQFMLTSKSIKLIYDKLRVPIFMGTVDMYPMTGGCYYFNDCQNYQNECIKCPAARLFTSKDMPHKNFLYKKHVYRTTNCVYICNKWMKERVIKSRIISEKKISTSLVGCGNPLFLLKDNKQKLRDELNISNDKFIIFAGAANVELPRKGFKEMISAVNEFHSSICNANDVVLVLAGRNSVNISPQTSVEVINVGFLTADKLAKMYRAADVYLSPSLDDAGPSMVVQSLLSGTPVVAFNIGIAPEVILHKETGYIAQLADIHDFAQGIHFIYDLDNTQRKRMGEKCRELTIQNRNPDSFIKRFERLYEEFRQK